MRQSVLFKSALALALAAPLLASAESNFVSAPGPLAATARLDFRVVIPRVLFLRVGSDSPTVDLLTFNIPAANIGTATASPTQSVAVRVLGNSGAISIAASSTTPGLTSGGLPTIPWSQIVATSTDNTNLNVPQIGAATGVTVPVTSGNVTDRTTTWNYAYANSSAVAPGTYDGRITYTASAP